MMMLALCGLAIITGLVVLAPRFMMLMIWPVVFCYPQELFFGLLPWNAGLDDLLIVVMAGRMLLSQSSSQRSPAWAKSAVWLAVGMLFMEAIAEYTGALYHPVLLPLATKTTLKGIILVLFTLAMALDIRTDRDIRQHVLAFAIAVSLAFLLVAVCFWYPSLSAYWEVHEEAWKYTVEGASRRAFGPFNGTGSVGLTACATVPLGLGLLIHKPRGRFLFFVALLMLVTSVGALVLAKSRSGIFGLAGMFLLLPLFSKRRGYILAMEAIGVLVGVAVLAGGDILGALEQRVTLDRLNTDMATRVALWFQAITDPSPSIMFFGEGYDAFFLKYHTSPHNGYLDIVFLWGFGGIVMFTTLIHRSLKWSRGVLRCDPVPHCRGVAWAFLWSLIATATFALATGPWYRATFRMTVYFFLVVVYVRYVNLHCDEGMASGEDGLSYSRAAMTPDVARWA